MKHLTAVEIQKESCTALQENFPASDIHNMSFFLYEQPTVCDCVVMNPPFSMKFKDLTEEERTAIQKTYTWKRSGVVDDIFMLKGLEHSRRWGFFLMFPGVAYRRGEKKFRGIIGNKLVELNTLLNGFDDTAISVLFAVVDKEKTTSGITREVYDCNTKEVIIKDTYELEPDQEWRQLNLPPPPKKPINVLQLENEAQEAVKRNLEQSLGFSRMVATFEKTEQKFNRFCEELSYIALSKRF